MSATVERRDIANGSVPASGAVWQLQPSGSCWDVRDRNLDCGKLNDGIAEGLRYFGDDIGSAGMVRRKPCDPRSNRSLTNDREIACEPRVDGVVRSESDQDTIHARE